jgi:Type I phosphodiesterase / nucleotide pyrophosphatase
VARPSAPPTAAVALASVAVSAITTVYVLGAYLPTLNTPHTSLEGVPHAPLPTAPTPGLARRLSFVVVDGLSYDVARSLEELRPLRRDGVVRSLAVEFPTYTSPSLVSFVTGLGPRDSGVRRNGDLHPVVGLDSVLLAAGDARVPITLFGRGFSEAESIFLPPRGTAVYNGRFALAVDLGRRGLAGRELPPLDGKEPLRALDVIHWGEVDEEGHRHGGSSPEYLAEAHNAAAYLLRYAISLDLEQDTLVVVSDHGHLPEGGHGGDEPGVSHAFFLGVGGFFRHGVELGERPMRDVAATLAILGGLRVPSSNLGMPMLDALALDDDQTSFVLAAPFEEAATFLCRLHPDPRCAQIAPLVKRLRKPDPTAWEEAQALYATLYRARDLDLAAGRAAGGPRRLAVVTGVLALAALAGARALARAGVKLSATGVLPALVLPLVNAGVYAAYLLSRGYQPTFSRFPPAVYFASDALIGGALAMAAVMLVARLARTGRAAPWVLLGASAVPFALLSAFVGCDPLTLPPNVAGALELLLGPALLSAAVGAVVLAWLGERWQRARG